MKKKNMFTNKILTLCLFIGIILSSCVKSDLLDRDDPGGLDEAKAWTTDYLTKLGMNGVYAALRLGEQTTSSTPEGAELYQFDKFVTSQDRNAHAFLSGTASPSILIASRIWQYMYEGIGRTNDAIHNIPKEKCESSDQDKARYVAEAKFLRAYFYLRLNQLFKGVPIYDEPITVQNALIPRSTEQQVWDFILQDLDDCIKETNLPNKYDKGHKEYGRVTKGAAYALRGKVYMYLKKWGDAVKDFEEVEKCGYNLFQGGYKELFKEANEQSEEMIFSIQHIASPGYGSTIQLFCGTRSVYGEGWNHYMVAPHTVDRYENLDGSKFNWDDIIPGYNAMLPKNREVFFLRDTVNLAEKLQEAGFPGDVQIEARAIAQSVKERLEAIQKDPEGGGAEKLYLPDGNEARIKKAYENRDPRLAANVITPYSTFRGAMGGADHIVTMRWPYRGDNKGVQDLRSDLRTQFLYFHRKFVAEGTNEITNRMYGPIDHPIIRFADVLLMKAEALNEDNKTDAAIIEVNKVRKRAGLALLNSSPQTTINGQADLRERIRNERRVEFVNEGISYFDELRWGTLKQTVYPDEGKGAAREVWGKVIRQYTWPSDDRKGYIWPIPQTAMDRNPELEQNDAWK